MAKQTRAQRRARRSEQALAPPAPPPQRPSTKNGGDAGREPGRRPSAPGAGFVAESWAELKKVEWPGQPQLVQGTAVVLIACVIVGVFLWLSDLAFKPFVQNILLGQ